MKKLAIVLGILALVALGVFVATVVIPQHAGGEEDTNLTLVLDAPDAGQGLVYELPPVKVEGNPNSDAGAPSSDVAQMSPASDGGEAGVAAPVPTKGSDCLTLEQAVIVSTLLQEQKGRVAELEKLVKYHMQINLQLRMAFVNAQLCGPSATWECFVDKDDDMVCGCKVRQHIPMLQANPTYQSKRDSPPLDL